MKARTFFACLFLLALLAGCGEVPPTVTTGIKGNADALQPYAGVRPAGGRTEIGLYGLYTDGLADGVEEAYGGGLYATYDVVQDANFVVADWSVPATLYVGGQLGGLWVNPDAGDHQGDVTAALATGLLFGDPGAIQIGPEIQYALTEDLWKQFSADDPETSMLFNIKYSW